jgi:hypothetical protein
VRKYRTGKKGQLIIVSHLGLTDGLRGQSGGIAASVCPVVCHDQPYNVVLNTRSQGQALLVMNTTARSELVFDALLKLKVLCASLLSFHSDWQRGDD